MIAIDCQDVGKLIVYLLHSLISFLLFRSDYLTKKFFASNLKSLFVSRRQKLLFIVIIHCLNLQINFKICSEI